MLDLPVRIEGKTWPIGELDLAADVDVARRVETSVRATRIGHYPSPTASDLRYAFQIGTFGAHGRWPAANVVGAC